MIHYPRHDPRPDQFMLLNVSLARCSSCASDPQTAEHCTPTDTEPPPPAHNNTALKNHCTTNTPQCTTPHSTAPAASSTLPFPNPEALIETGALWLSHEGCSVVGSRLVHYGRCLRVWQDEGMSRNVAHWDVVHATAHLLQMAGNIRLPTLSTSSPRAN